MRNDIKSVLMFVKNTLKEDGKSRKIDNIDIDTDDGYTVSLFWHFPSINVGYYPILQIDYQDKTIFNGEGTENPEHWHDVADRALKKISKEDKVNV